MSNHKCSVKKNANYQVKQRYIPTYVHQQIFEEAPLRPYSARCTPTFHSTVFDTDGYNIQTVHSKNLNHQAQVNSPVQKVIYYNQTQQRRVEDNSYPNRALNASRDKWFDHTKENTFLSIKNGQNRGYSRERKNVDLSSDLVFTDFTYENKSTVLRADNKPVGHICKTNYQPEQKQLVQPQQTALAVIPQPSQPRKVSQQVGQKIDQRAPQNNQTKQNKSVTNSKQQNAKQTKQQKLALKGRSVATRPQTSQKAKLVLEKPTFTVIRKSRVHQH